MRAKKVLILFALAVSVLSTAVYAASVQVQSTTYQSVTGVYYQVTGNFAVAAQGFYVAKATTQASAQPCTWGSGPFCSTALTAGHWIYIVTVTLVTNPNNANQVFTISVQWDTNQAQTPSYTSMGSLTFTVPTNAQANSQYTFVFDTGVSSFNAPAGIVITIQ